jgi:hypothetical protein
MNPFVIFMILDCRFKINSRFEETILNRKILNLKSNYTLLFFGGLQPLCGIGVISFIDATSIPF